MRGLERFKALSAHTGCRARADKTVCVREAIGEVSEDIKNAFGHLSGSMIHDLYGLRAIMGIPKQVVSSEIWYDGWGINRPAQTLWHGI